MTGGSEIRDQGSGVRCEEAADEILRCAQDDSQERSRKADGEQWSEVSEMMIGCVAFLPGS